MIYRILIGYDTNREPIWIWKCDCEKCLTSPSPCQSVIHANKAEKNKPQDTAIYVGLRR